MQDIKSKKGFTIIEVVLVLAIAGLIFLMVFIALPAMQRSQRDTQRRNDYSQLSAAMTTYMTSNNGQLPGTGSLEPARYVNEDGTDPDGNKYILEVVNCSASQNQSAGEACSNTSFDLTGTTVDRDTGTKVYIVKNARCDGGKPVYSKSSRSFAIYGQVESGNSIYCAASS